MADPVHLRFCALTGYVALCGAPDGADLTSDGEAVSCETCQEVGGPVLELEKMDPRPEPQELISALAEAWGKRRRRDG